MIAFFVWWIIGSILAFPTWFFIKDADLHRPWKSSRNLACKDFTYKALLGILAGGLLGPAMIILTILSCMIWLFDNEQVGLRRTGFYDILNHPVFCKREDDK